MRPRQHLPVPPRRLALALAALLVATACGSGGSSARSSPTPTTGTSTSEETTSVPLEESVYAHTGSGDVAPRLTTITSRVYVPNSESNTVDVIDPATMQVIDHFKVGKQPQHITPSWDMRTLYIDNDKQDTLTEIDPATGKTGRSFDVTDPYNVYFTPDGAHAVVVSEQKRRLEIRDPKTWQHEKFINLYPPCRGANHLDFSPRGTWLLVSCEFSGHVVKVDMETMAPTLGFKIGGKPVDVRISPDGRVFYVANETRNGVSVVDPYSMRELTFIHTGKGAHGFVVSRDGRSLYVTNRDEGTISVINFDTRAVVAKWLVHGWPDMGGVSIDGKVLWVSGRYGQSVYAIDTTTGQRIATIPVGKGPHGVCVFPQPGRYSLGHTGNYR